MDAEGRKNRKKKEYYCANCSSDVVCECSLTDKVDALCYLVNWLHHHQQMLTICNERQTMALILEAYGLQEEADMVRKGIEDLLSPNGRIYKLFEKSDKSISDTPDRSKQV